MLPLQHITTKPPANMYLASKCDWLASSTHEVVVSMDPRRSTPTPSTSTPRGEIAELHYFDAADDSYRDLRLSCGMLCAAFNAQPLSVSKEERARAWFDIVRPRVHDECGAPEAPMIKSPINIDYGSNLHIAPSCFINRNCVFIDSLEYPIIIGENTLIGPGAQIHAVTHPADWRERKGRNGPSLAGPVTIGNDCFIGSYAVILPGITIGDGCVIGASAVVTRSIPAYHVAVGNPAQPIRKVSGDVPDAPGLRYERQGGRFVVQRQTTEDAMADLDGLSEIEQAAEARQDPRAVLDAKSVNPRQILVDVAILVAAVLIFFAILHGVLD